jgi:hypothetical protein
MNGNVARSIAAAAMCFSAAFAAGESAMRLDSLGSNEIGASGIGLLMPVIGRLTGAGDILFTTTLDVSSFSPGPVTVDYKFQGADVKTGAAISFTGTFVNDGGTKMRSFSDVRFDDFIDSMVQRGWITAAQEADGVLGSMLIVFEGVSTPNLAAARARFFSSQSGGTIGVSLNGHVLTSNDGTAVAGAFADTRTIPSTPQLYSNIFLTNFGQFNGSTFVSSDDTVKLTAFSSATGQPIGTPLTVTLPSFRTLSTSLSALGVPAGAGAVIVLAKATSGQGVLVGVGAEIDDATKDPSGFDLNPVPASSTGPTPAGDLASQLAGNWIGTWNNTTFGSSGSAALAIVVNTSAKTYAVTLTLGGNVFGGSAPPAQTFSGSYTTASGATFTGHDSLFGDITFSITPAGVITGSATNVPSSNVSAVSFNGTASATTITINYSVTLKPSGTAAGTVTLTHS